MPRYYCDYCDTYLTHDSPSVRKQHNAGYKHKANIRAYYQKFEEQQTQTLLDMKIKEHLGQTAVYQQIGAAYNQHLAAFPGARPRLPVMPPLLSPVPGAVPPQLAPGIRPAVLPIPIPGTPSYANPPMMAPPGMMQPSHASSMAQQPGGMAPPPTTGASSLVPGVPPSSLGGGGSGAMQQYKANSSGNFAAATTSANVGQYSYPQAAPAQTSH